MAKKLLVALPVILLGVLAFAKVSSAATYYVDYQGGSDSNAGTSMTAPWQHAPGMNGCVATCASIQPKAGDSIILKGGVTWPNAAFPWSFPWSGSASSPIYIGVNPSWYAGASWTRPIFDAQNKMISGKNTFINGADDSYVTIDNLEMKDYYWDGSAASAYGASTYFYLPGTSHITIENGYFHAWSHGPSSDGTGDALNIVQGQTGNNANDGDVIEDSIFDGAPNGTDSGAMTYGWPNVIDSVGRNMSNGLLLFSDGGNSNGSIAEGNTIGPINQSFDSSDHENCIEPMAIGTVLIYNNVFHDCTAVNLLTEGPTGPQTDYIFNNIFYGSASGAPIPVQLDDQAPVNNVNYYLYNNTIYANNTCARIVSRGSGPVNVVDARNNLCITTGAFADFSNGATTLINANNIVMTPTQAAADGMSSSEVLPYQPNVSLGQGQNLSSLATGQIAALSEDTAAGCTVDASYHVVCPARISTKRPASGAWDVGAYQYSSAGSSGSTGGSSSTPPPSSVVFPSAPTGLKVTATTASSVSLSWTAAVAGTYGISGYRVYRNGAQIGTVTGISYTDSGLSAATTYQYSVAAYDGQGNASGQTSAVNGMTQAATTTNSGSSGSGGVTGTTPTNSANIYVAQSAAGAGNGSSCANAEPVSFFNSSGNWGSGSGKIGPGTVVNLCGTITSSLTAQGSGSSGNPVTIYFQPGAQISVPYCAGDACLNIAGKSWITVNGGTACGWVNGAEVPCNGTIQSTANGTSLANHIATNMAIDATGASNIEIENLLVANMYVHNSATDQVPSTYPSCVKYDDASHIHIHNMIGHDMRWCFAGNDASNVEINNTEVYNIDHAISGGANTPGTTATNLSFHDNYFHDYAMWDVTGDVFHHDGFQIWGLNEGNSTGNDGVVNGLYIYNNLMGGNMGSYHTGQIYLTDSVANAYIFNNVVAGSGATPAPVWALIRVDGTTGDNALGPDYIFNNTTIGANTQGYCVWAQYIGSVTVENNALEGCGESLQINNVTSMTVGHNVYTGSVSGVSGDTGSKTVSSLGVNETTGAPLAGAATIGAGTNLTSAITYAAAHLDTAGNARPSTGAWDAGAFEYETSSGSASAPTSTPSAPVTATPPPVPGRPSLVSAATSSIVFQWSASIGATGYDVYRGGVLIATTTTTSYTAKNLLPGDSYSFAVASYDAGGDTSNPSSALQATTLALSSPPATPTSTATSTPSSPSDTTPPLSSFSNLSSGETLSGLATVSVLALDQVGISHVDLYVDGILEGSDTSSPYNFTVDTTALADGSHTIIEKAYDTVGNVDTETLNIDTANGNVSGGVGGNGSSTNNGTGAGNGTTTVSGLQAEIASLLAEIQQLEAQLNGAGGGSSSSSGSASGSGSGSGSGYPSHHYFFSHNLGPGSDGADVSALQEFLKDDGDYPQGYITGYYGSLTEAAVQQYQRKHGIVDSGSPSTTGYGSIGPTTRQWLNGGN